MICTSCASVPPCAGCGDPTPDETNGVPECGRCCHAGLVIGARRTPRVQVQAWLDACDGQLDRADRRFAVTAKIVGRNGKVLAITRGTRPEDMANLGLIGGKVEVGETLTAAIVREVWEETRLVIEEPTMGDIIHAAEDIDGFYTVSFSCQIVGERTTPQPCAEGIPQWVDGEDLLTPTCRFRYYNAYVITGKALDEDSAE